MSTAEKRRYTAKEYLAFERAAESKHEYYQGEIFAMTGASRAHNLITVNLATAFHVKLRGRGCEVYASDMRVKVNPTGLYTYPDVTVVCSKPQFEDDVFDTLVNPKLIIEVLSDSTELYDRGEKFAHYQTIDSLQEYVLVSQRDYRVEVFTRQETDEWLLKNVTGSHASVTFRSIDFTLDLEEVYFQVEMPEKSQEASPE
jgi:Uma2 family endonuclease